MLVSMPDRQDRKETKMSDIEVEGKALTGKARKAFDRFVEAKRAEAEAKKAKAEAEAELFAFLGDARVAFIGKHIALRVIASKNSSFDREVMKKSYPEAFSVCLKETPYDYLKVIV
jgi:hypothetical protein